VLLEQQVARFVELRGVLFHGTQGIVYGFQLLVINPDQLQRFFELRARFGRDQRHGVAEVMGDIAHGDQHVPILFQMPYLFFRGDIRRGEHGVHAGKGARFFRMDGQYARAGIRASLGRAEQHAFHIDIVGVNGGAKRFFGGVYPVHVLADKTCECAGFHGRVR
jgi:hypothetical protein